MEEGGRMSGFISGMMKRRVVWSLLLLKAVHVNYLSKTFTLCVALVCK